MIKTLEPHFDIDSKFIDGRKHFFLPDALPWSFSKPTREELAALEVEIKGHLRNGDRARAKPLEDLRHKLFISLDSMGRQRTRPEMEQLVRHEGIMPSAGPTGQSASPFEQDIRTAILGGRCVRFTYRKSETAPPTERRIAPYGLVRDGATVYLLAAPPASPSNVEPWLFCFDRMLALDIDEARGAPPADWLLDDYLARDNCTFRGERYAVRLETLPAAAERARTHCFHPAQQREEHADGSMVFTFEANGLWELAWDIFTWRGEVIIHEPQQLTDVLREHLELAFNSIKSGDNESGYY